MHSSFPRSALTLLVGALAVAVANVLVAQESIAAPDMPRWQAEVAADVEWPIGDVRQHVRHVAGATAHLHMRLDPYGLFLLRFASGSLQHAPVSKSSW